MFLKAGTGLTLGVSSKRVVLTNYATKDMRAACNALGADRVFDKSSEIEELLEYCDHLDDGDNAAHGEHNPMRRP
jgi:hypothetical protein